MKLHVLSVFTFLLFFAGEPRTDELAAANAYLEGRWEVDGHSDLHSIVFHEGNIVTFHTKPNSNDQKYAYQFCYKVNSLSTSDKLIQLEFYMVNGLKELAEPRRTMIVKIADRDEASLTQDKHLDSWSLKRSRPYIIPK